MYQILQPSLKCDFSSKAKSKDSVVLSSAAHILKKKSRDRVNVAEEFSLTPDSL